MGSFNMEATQINYRRDETIKTVDQKLQELSQESAIDTDIAPVFKSTSSYEVGDLVYYRNKLYTCTTPHSGAWAAADFTATDVTTAIKSAAAVKADEADIAPAFDATASYAVGDLVYYGGTIYRCTNAHEGDWDADDFSATTISGELNEINSNLTSLYNMRLPRDLIDNGNSAVTITFSGSGHTRCANMFLILATQAKVYTPISIMFTGVQGANQSITSVVVSDNDLNVTASGLSISIPANLSGWGYHMLVKMYPNDNISVSVS